MDRFFRCCCCIGTNGLHCEDSKDDLLQTPFHKRAQDTKETLPPMGNPGMTNEDLMISTTKAASLKVTFKLAAISNGCFSILEKTFWGFFEWKENLFPNFLPPRYDRQFSKLSFLRCKIIASTNWLITNNIGKSGIKFSTWAYLFLLSFPFCPDGKIYELERRKHLGKC